MAPGVVADVPAFRVPDVGPRAFAVFVDFRQFRLWLLGKWLPGPLRLLPAWAVPVESLTEWPYKNTIGSLRGEKDREGHFNMLMHE